MKINKASLAELILIVCGILAFSYNIKAATEKGRIVDSIICNNCPEYSYALYLPPRYSDSIKWPVIYIFDPGAKSKFAINLFIPSAELYGYILVCSNNSRNGLHVTEHERIFNCMMTDVESKYAVDRIYTSGCSGGSRVASIIGLKNKKVVGVIGCAAGFYDITSLNFLPQFDYFGLVGDCDVNYIEMNNLKIILDAINLKTELRIFEGGHSWPSSELIQEAIEWMELMAIQKKYKPMDSTFVKSLYHKNEMLAQDWLERGRIIESVECYKNICKWFPEYLNTNYVKAFSDSIQHTKEYTKALKKEHDILLIELEFQEKIYTELKKTELIDELSDSTRLWWIKQIESIKKTSSGKDFIKQRMAKRQLNFLTIHCYEIANGLLDGHFYKTAAIFYQIIAWIQPDNSNVYYLLARTYALDKDINKSVLFLKFAIKKGFKNFTTIANDSTFDIFRNEKKFTDLLAKYKK